MKDVADLAGVSVKTVSNVVNDYVHVSASMRSRVEESLAALGYRMNVSARNLRKQRTGMISLAVPELALPYFAELSAAVIKTAEAKGWTVVIEQTGAEWQREADILSGSRMRVSDGVLFAPSESWPGAGRDSQTDFPLVVLGEQVLNVPADYVTMDNVEASRAATAHLIQLGRRRIVALGGSEEPAHSTATRRLTGYYRAVHEAGLAVDPALVVTVNEWHRSTGAAAMARLLDDEVQFDAVFALNDTLALGALFELRRRGLHIPNDVAVIGFDDIDDARYCLPTLSSVDPGRSHLAEVAVERLLARIAGKHEGEFHRITTESALIGRESTGDACSAGQERVISVQPGRIDTISYLEE